MDFMDFLGSNAVTNGLLGVGALASVGNNIFNYGLQKEAFDYQKSLNDTIMAREDTALQRRMADAAAAGVNPYAVVGQGAGSGGSVSAPKAAQLPNGVMDALLGAIQAKQGILQTKGQELANENAVKQGLILNEEHNKLLNTNKILGDQAWQARIQTNRDWLQLARDTANFNFDFDTDWTMPNWVTEDGTREWGIDGYLTGARKYGYKYYGDQYDNSNFSLNKKDLYNKDWEDYLYTQARKNLTLKENEWYDAEHGVGIGEGLLGTIFKILRMFIK